MKKTFIYCLKHPETDEIRYIGKTIQKLSYRLAQHLTEKSNHKRANWIKSLLNKNLKPVIELITICDWADSAKIEIALIKEYKDKGFRLTNMTDGGDGALGYITSEETKKKQSIAQKTRFLNGAKHPMLGKTHTKEAKEKISKTHKGVKRSDSFREKRRQIMLGHKKSPKTIEKVRQHHLIKVVQLDKNYKLIKLYDGIVYAKQEGFNEKGIINCAKKRQKFYKNFIWMYLTDYEKFLKQLLCRITRPNRI